MIRTGWLAALVFALASPLCSGQGASSPQKPAEEWTVKLETFSDQSVTGQIRLPSIAIDCELGTYEIKPEKIKAIEFAPPEAGVPEQVGFNQGIRRNGTVITATGEKVSGMILVPFEWRIDTDLGTLTPNARKLKTLTFIARAAADAGRGPGETEPGGHENRPSSLPAPGQPSGDKPGGPQHDGHEKKS